MSWVWLTIAGLMEIAWAVGLKHPATMSKPLTATAVVAAMLASLWFLWLAMRTIPLGTAYTVWGAIGNVGVVAFGIFLFGESATPARLGFVALIMIGVIGLYWVTE
ncbi:MAG: multidrug efflux SMR transporter [Alphaproteobacteria bacterium]|nr:multidrug efflux SMR transporter [Alphaproteobacteria bacterium]